MRKNVDRSIAIQFNRRELAMATLKLTRPVESIKILIDLFSRVALECVLCR